MINKEFFYMAKKWKINVPYLILVHLAAAAPKIFGRTGFYSRAFFSA
jgi:hypothetical protein